MGKYSKQIFTLIFGIIIIGAIIPYACQFILPFYFNDAPIAGTEIWNQYVSIILGTIATILSIVSLKMCFDSANEAKNTELRTQKMLDEITEKISVLTEKQDTMFNQINESRNKTVDSKNVFDPDWKNNQNKVETEI